MDNCKHKFIFIESVYKRVYGYYNYNYIRIDRFYCEKCLEEKENRKNEYSRETPEWYQG